MCVDFVMFISFKKTGNLKKLYKWYVFDDATIYGGHLCPHTYVTENKNEKCWKFRWSPFQSFIIWMAFMCKDLHCILNLNELKRKKMKEARKTLCVETTLHNIDVLQWFWCFLVKYFQMCGMKFLFLGFGCVVGNNSNYILNRQQDPPPIQYTPRFLVRYTTWRC